MNDRAREKLRFQNYEHLLIDEFTPEETTEFLGHAAPDIEAADPNSSSVTDFDLKPDKS